MSWSKHDVLFDHDNGEETLFWMQTDGNTYILSEHPDNKGPHVSSLLPNTAMKSPRTTWR